MAEITGNIIKQRYAPGIRRNSFYQEQKLPSVTGKTYPIEKSRPETYYYIDHKTGQFKAQNTLLLG